MTEYSETEYNFLEMMKMFECECCEELYSDDRMMSSEKNICVHCWEILEDDERTLYPTMEDEATMGSSF